MIELDTIYNEDCLVGMKRIQSGSVDLIVTSPPYDNLRKYGGAVNCLTFDKFKAIATEIKRVLKDGGVCVWVVGDATIDGSETGTSFRQALYFKDECGLLLYDTMLYMKANPIPQTQKRYEQMFEYMFVLSKGKPKTFNPIMERCKKAGKPQQWGRKINTDEKTAKHLRADDMQLTRETKIRGNVFIYGIGGRKTGHPAIFPERLALEQVYSWSNEQDTVLDPFMGSGTTAIACVKARRHFIGFELSKEYYDEAIKSVDGWLALRQEKESNPFLPGFDDEIINGLR